MFVAVKCPPVYLQRTLEYVGTSSHRYRPLFYFIHVPAILCNAIVHGKSYEACLMHAFRLNALYVQISSECSVKSNVLWYLRYASSTKTIDMVK